MLRGPGLLHGGGFQSMRIEKTCPGSACRSARLLALRKRPPIEDLIARLTDAEFLAECLATGLVVTPQGTTKTKIT